MCPWLAVDLGPVTTLPRVSAFHQSKKEQDECILKNPISIKAMLQSCRKDGDRKKKGKIK